MLHYVRKGERELSALAIYRLEELERAAGIEPVLSEIRKRSVPLHEVGHTEINWRLRAERAEGKLAKIKELLEFSSDDIHPTAVELGNAVIDKQRSERKHSDV